MRTAPPMRKVRHIQCSENILIPQIFMAVLERGSFDNSNQGMIMIAITMQLLAQCISGYKLRVKIASCV